MVPAAVADTELDWLLTGAISGDGSLNIGTPDGLGFDITSIAGTINSNSIDTTLSPNNFAGADNVLYLPGPYLDINGVSFTDTAGFSWNIYNEGNPTNYLIAYTNDPSNLDSYINLDGENFVLTPIPPALLLFASALGVTALLGKWRELKTTAAMAVA
jgi:hypothetical protein